MSTLAPPLTKFYSALPFPVFKTTNPVLAVISIIHSAVWVEQALARKSTLTGISVFLQEIASSWTSNLRQKFGTAAFAVK